MGVLSHRLRNRISLLKSYVLKQSFVSGGPLSLAIESTTRCNLFCPMCRRATTYFPPRDMDFYLFKKIIDECADYLEFAVPYGAGEPLLNPELLDMMNPETAEK